MHTKRAHILLPEDLIREIDALVGPRGRSSFLVETARHEVRRQKLLHFLENEEPAWKSANHPELAGGAVHWVRQVRKENESRAGTEVESKSGTQKRRRKQIPRTR